MRRARDRRARARARAEADEAEAVVAHASAPGFARFAGLGGAPADAGRRTPSCELRRGRATAALGLADDEPRSTTRGCAALAGAGGRGGRQRAPRTPSFARPRAARRRCREVEGYDEETAALGAGRSRRGSRAAAIGASGAFGLYGYFTSGVTRAARSPRATGHARLRSARPTRACLALAAVDGASGYAAADRRGASAEIDPAAVAERGRRERRADARARDELEPGSYRGGARALRDRGAARLLRVRQPSTASRLLEERSFLAGRIGERVVRRAA